MWDLPVKVVMMLSQMNMILRYSLLIVLLLLNKNYL